MSSVKPCRKCGRASEVPVTVQFDSGPQYTFDCFDCAVETLAPRCPECGRVYLGRPVPFGDQHFCSTECAQRRQVRDAWSPARGDGTVDTIGSTPPRVGVGVANEQHRPTPGAFTDAHVGDVIIVHSRTIDRPPRRATILELRGPHGAPPYEVRWHDDDHVSLCFPGSDATLERHEATATAGG